MYILGGSSVLLAITTMKTRSLGSRNRDLQYFTAVDRPQLRSKSDQDLRKPELIIYRRIVEGGKSSHYRCHDPARVGDVSKFRQVNAWEYRVESISITADKSQPRISKRRSGMETDLAMYRG